MTDSTFNAAQPVGMLGRENDAFHRALRKYPDAFEALHSFWNDAFAAQPPAAPVETDSDGGSLVERLRGRALYLRNIGEVKSPELMEQAAAALSRCSAATEVDLGPTNAAFHRALKKFPDAFEALHYFWNEGIAGQPQPSAATGGAEEAIRDWWYSDRREPMTSKEAAKSLIWYLAKCGLKIIRDEPQSFGVWQPINTAPKDEMFIWAYRLDGKWRTGLAYRNVSGGWSDAYGADAPRHATHWHPMPEPPSPLSRPHQP